MPVPLPKLARVWRDPIRRDQRPGGQRRARFMADVGTPDRTRTCYPRLRRPVLYPDELRAHAVRLLVPACTLHQNTKGRREDGRSSQIRTDDPLLPKQMRYRAALYSEPAIIPP